jgi:hypothetical protein
MNVWVTHMKASGGGNWLMVKEGVVTDLACVEVGRGVRYLVFCSKSSPKALLPAGMEVMVMECSGNGMVVNSCADVLLT